MTFKERLIQAASLTEEEQDGTDKVNSFIKEFISTLDELWNHKFKLSYSSVGCRQHSGNYYVEMEIKISNNIGSFSEFSERFRFLVPLLGFPCFFLDKQCEYVRCEDVGDLENHLIEWIKEIKPFLACVQD
jgi:hypothetical protein